MLRAHTQDRQPKITAANSASPLGAYAHCLACLLSVGSFNQAAIVHTVACSVKGETTIAAEQSLGCRAWTQQLMVASSNPGQQCIEEVIREHNLYVWGAVGVENKLKVTCPSPTLTPPPNLPLGSVTSSLLSPYPPHPPTHTHTGPAPLTLTLMGCLLFHMFLWCMTTSCSLVWPACHSNLFPQQD